MLFTWSQYQEQIIKVSQNGFIHILLALILVDILTGILKSFKQKNTSSTISLYGILKHIVIFISVLLISIYLPLFDYSIASEFFIGYIIISYLISILENWALLDLPIPNFILERLIKLKEGMEAEIKLKKRKEEDDD